jgi:oxygen-independent coproporphyrinogen-3 oxidase
MYGLYVHIPFCLKRCSYCNFFSSLYCPERAEKIIQALKKEIESLPEEINFRTLYIGGGTPTVLAPELLHSILKLLLRKSFIFPAEKTIEANPETLHSENLSLIKDMGINRLSLGVQSLNDSELKNLGRIHDSSKSYEAFSLSRKAGFRNINVDLIFGTPAQTLTDWQDTLNKVVSLAPEHISTYGLSVEQGTALSYALNTHIIELPPQDAVADMYEYAVDFLTENGYVHYEISNFSRPGYKCHHNYHYWNRGAYYGLGPGACSFVNGKRFFHVRDINLYCENIRQGKHPQEEEEILDEKQALFESIFLGLRKKEGLNTEEIKKRYHVNIEQQFCHHIEEFCHSGLMKKDGDTLRLTIRGMLLSNEIFCRFIDY